jgi:hypothetical protein
MIGARWLFGGAEFEVLLRGFGRDRLPFPLQYRSACSDIHALELERLDAAKSLQPKLDQTLHAAMSALLEPAARVEVCGYANLHTTDKVRLHAGVRGHAAAVAWQHPTDDPDVGGDVALLACAAGEFPQRIIDALPNCRAGSGSRFAVARSDLRSATGGSVLHDAREDSDRARAREFFARERAAVVECTVFPGPAFDSRPTEDGSGFFLMDFPGDGRYRVRSGETIDVLAADPVAIADELRRLIAAVTRVTTGV